MNGTRLNAAHGLTLPMIPVYLQSKGISAGEIAVFAFVAQLCAFCSRLLAAIVADRTGHHKLVCLSHLSSSDRLCFNVGSNKSSNCTRGF